MDIIEIVEKCKKVPGAISVTEMIVIHRLVLNELLSPDNLWAIDLGAHAGKSSMMASSAMSRLKRNDLFCMVDLIYNIENPEWWNTYQGDQARKHGKDVRECIPWPIAKDPRKITKIQVWHNLVSNLKVNLFAYSSLQFLEKYEGPFSYAFIDTDDHQEELVLAEVKALADKMAEGALVLLHDYGNYRGPIRAGQYLLNTGLYEEIKIDWRPVSNFVKERNLDEGNDSWAGPDHKHLGCFRRKQ